MTNIFADNASSYYENGYNPVPVEPYSKAIKITNWQIFSSVKMPEETLDTWIDEYPSHNIGIVLGEPSGIIAIDFDHDVGGIHKQVSEILTGSLVKKKGSKGFTAFYRYNGEVKKQWRKDGFVCVELLSTGAQTVVPPSIHPDTEKPYTWLTDDTLQYTKADELTYLPSDFIEKMDKLFGYDIKKKEYSGSINFDKPKLSEVEHALTYIAADSYSTLITMGMAIKEEFGDGGFDIWETWASKSAKYNPDSMNYRRQYGYFGKYSGKRVTIGSVFHEAMGHGYIPLTKNVFNDSDYEPEFMLPAGFKVTLGDKVILEVKGDESETTTEETAAVDIEEKKAETSFDSDNNTIFPQHLLDHAPGFPGVLAKWIDSTAGKRQPILSLGAAICAAGTLYAHKVASESNLRTNFMILGLAESGCGKDHARQCMTAFFLLIEKAHKLVGKFASDTSVITSLKKIDGTAFALLDEIGLELQMLMRKQASSHEAKILAVLMELFSSASSIYLGKQYADKEKEREDLIQPCLSIYGTSVAKPFYDAMTSNHAIDGFLARWLIFQSDDIDPQIREPGKIDRIPENVIAYVNKINNIETHTGAEVKTISGRALDSLPQPKVVSFTSGAKRVLSTFSIVCNDNRLKEIRGSGSCAAIWARTREHAIKLALVSHDIDKGVICDDVMKWACELALYLSNVAIKGVRDNVSDSEHEAILKKVFNIIARYNERHNRPMRERELKQSTKFIDNRKIGEVLSQMSDAGMIEISQVENKSNGSKSTVFKSLKDK